ncbi:MAG: SMI1/KNR4 family protein [Chromatiaceae bacterium]|nr:SMI1/KNR4 family protein [Chromatiaceae bacterium]
MDWQIFEENHQPLREELVEGVEKIVQFELPAEYVECVQKYHGAQPKHGRLEINAGGQPWEIGFGALLTLDPLESNENVIQALSVLRKVHRIGASYLPFAVGGGGDYLCFDYSSGESEPKVVFWFHELEAEEAIFPVANSFGELLAMLQPYEE